MTINHEEAAVKQEENSPFKVSSWMVTTSYIHQNHNSVPLSNQHQFSVNPKRKKCRMTENLKQFRARGADKPWWHSHWITGNKHHWTHIWTVSFWWNQHLMKPTSSLYINVVSLFSKKTEETSFLLTDTDRNRYFPSQSLIFGFSLSSLEKTNNYFHYGLITFSINQNVKILTMKKAVLCWVFGFSLLF